MDGWRYIRDRAEFVCPCGVGHYAHWARNRIHGCCPLGCCSRSFGDAEVGPFPGTEHLSVGDLVLCGVGFVGVLTSASPRTVKYQDGREAVAYVGIHAFGGVRVILHEIPGVEGDPNENIPVDTIRAMPGDPWSSRNPAKIGHLSEVSILDTTLVELVRRRTIEGWPTVELPR